MADREAFTASFDAGYENSLPEEFLAKYHIIECMNSAKDRDTLLVQDKTSGKKRVAKCYFGDGGGAVQSMDPLLSFSDASFQKEEYQNAGCLCVLREYVEGVTLAEYAKTHRLTEARITDLALKLVSAMKKLHESDPVIIHRDIKPENIIVRDDESLVLIDFGISRIYKEDQTCDTVFSGTRNYAPPEQYGFMQTDVRSDIYSFGVVLSWMLTGKAAPIKAPQTRLEHVAAKCCAFVPKQRYKNDAALLKALSRTTESYYTRTLRTWKCACLLACAVVLIFTAREAYPYLRAHSGETAYAFHEPLIEEAVRLSLERPDGVITRNDLEDVKKIFIFADQAYPDMDQYYVDHDAWYADDSRIHGDLTDLSDLSYMPNLRVLYICAAKVKDLSPLRSLDKLEEVALQDNAITDISALADKPYLREVYLLGNELHDIEPLRTWPSIRCMNLGETGDYDGGPLEVLKAIEMLELFHGPNAQEHLDGLYAESLRVGWTGQSDLSFLDRVSSVKNLLINWSDIRDISALEGREDIVYLNMESCAVDDLSPLFTMPNLTAVEMSVGEQEQMEKLTERYGQPSFEIIYIK